MWADLQSSVVATRRRGAATLVLTVLLCSSGLAGCGQKGPLTLPAVPGAASAPAR